MSPNQTVLPSRYSIEVLKEIWRQLEKKARANFILCVLFPMLQQIGTIVSFYLIIRITLLGINGEPSLEGRFLYSLGILLCIGGAATIGWINDRLQATQKVYFQRLARKHYVQKYVSIRGLPEEEKRHHISKLAQAEAIHIGPLVSVLQSITQLGASAILLFSITLAIAVVAPIISAIIGGLAMVLLMIVRWKKTPHFRPTTKKREQAIKQLRNSSNRIVFSENLSDLDVENYIKNDFDQLNQAGDIDRVTSQQKEQALVAIGSVAILTAAMIVVDPVSFANYPAASIIAFILVLRVSLQNIQQMIRHWGNIYRDRGLIFKLGGHDPPAVLK